MIPRNTSVIVVRRMRERFQTLSNTFSNEDVNSSVNILQE